MRDQSDEPDDTPTPQPAEDDSNSPFEDILATLKDADTTTDADSESADTDSNPNRPTDDRATGSQNRSRAGRRRASAARRRRRAQKRRKLRRRKQLALAAALLLGVVVIGFAVGIPTEFALLGSSSHPDAASSSSGVASTTDSAEVLQVARPDARYLTRVFTETTTEVAFCGRIHAQTSPPVLSFWMADTIESSSAHIRYSSANCPEDYQDVLLHTHPSGSLELSGQDRSVLTDSPLDVLCVQNGPLTAEPGDPLPNVACYGEPAFDTTALKQYHLRLSNQSTNANQP